MDHGGSHVINALSSVVCVFMFLENDRLLVVPNTHLRHKFMRLRNLLYGLQIAPAISHRELLLTPIRSLGVDGDCICPEW